MKDQFVDYETAKMLKELGFDEKCFAWYIIQEKTIVIEKCETNTIGVLKSPLWQQVEQWLWEAHKIRFIIEGCSCFCLYVCDSEQREIYSDRSEKFLSPITAKNEGIKAAVKYLHRQIKK